MALFSLCALDVFLSPEKSIHNKNWVHVAIICRRFVCFFSILSSNWCTANRKIPNSIERNHMVSWIELIFVGKSRFITEYVFLAIWSTHFNSTFFTVFVSFSITHDSRRVTYLYVSAWKSVVFLLILNHLNWDHWHGCLFGLVCIVSRWKKKHKFDSFPSVTCNLSTTQR